MQLRSEVQGILPVALGAMTREPVHCDLKNGGLLDDFTSENSSVMPELFEICVRWEQAAKAGSKAANAASSAVADASDLAGVMPNLVVDISFFPIIAGGHPPTPHKIVRDWSQ